MQSASFGIYWPNKNDHQVFLQGRPCLGYERIDNWILDPDTLESEHPLFTQVEKEFLHEVDIVPKDDASF
jgi:hypothetical protein